MVTTHALSTNNKYRVIKMNTNINKNTVNQIDVNKNHQVIENKHFHQVDMLGGISKNKFKKQFENTLELAAKEAEAQW